VKTWGMPCERGGRRVERDGRVPPEYSNRHVLEYMRIPGTAGKPGPGSGPVWRAEEAAEMPSAVELFTSSERALW